MKKTYFLLIISAISLCMLSCHSNASKNVSGQNAGTIEFDKQRAKSFIDSINLKFSEQIASADSLSLTSHYWPDAELLLDNSEVVKGKDILHAWGALIRMGVKEMSFSTTDITGSSTFIIETGSAEMKDGKKSLIDRAKYVVIWEKRNGEWKLYRDIGCTSLPAAK